MKMLRLKAPRVKATGCPTCGTGGIPGTACAGCVRQAHEAAVRRMRTMIADIPTAYPAGCDVRQILRVESEQAIAAWVGANLLLDELGLLLMKVGFELPDVGSADVARRP